MAALGSRLELLAEGFVPVHLFAFQTIIPVVCSDQCGTQLLARVDTFVFVRGGD